MAQETTTASDDLHELPSATDGKHYSITQSIALEHQLMEDDNEPTAATLDPTVLTSIIVTLRETLASDRKHYETTLADATAKNAALESRTADLEEQWELNVRKSQETEAKLVETERQLIESEQSLAMLRTTLEESRRGIMRLQSESKRSSIMGPPSSVGPTASAPTSRANKRLSLNPSAPLLALSPASPRTPGGGHRRGASMSDPGMGMLQLQQQQEYNISRTSTSPSPNPSPSLFPLTPNSGLSGSPPQLSDVLPDPEVATLRAELASTRRSLSDALEARHASEEVVRGLRDLIAMHTTEAGTVSPSAVELKGLNLPPLPSDPDIGAHGEEAPRPERKSGWSTLKLWRDPATAANGLPPLPPPKTDRHMSFTSNHSEPEAGGSSSGTPAAALSGFMAWTRGTAVVSGSGSDTGSVTSPPPMNAQLVDAVPSSAPPSSFRSKFGFFSKAPIGGETASITSTTPSLGSRPTSEMSGLSSAPTTHDGDHHDDEDDEAGMVQIVLAGDEGENHDEARLEDGGKPNVTHRGDVTPTVTNDGPFST